jgi:Rod binding domain-containing protein
MNIGPLSSSMKTRDSGSGIRNVDFHSSRNPNSQTQNSSSDHHTQLVHAARELVSQTFFGQMLKQMREDPFRSKLFDGGRGGQMFGAMYDQKLAERMARGAGNKLVMSIVHHIEKNMATHKGPPTPSSIEAKPAAAAGKPGGVSSQKSNPFKNVRIHVAHDFRA